MSRHSDKRDGNQLAKENDNSLNPKASPFSYTGLEESLLTVGQDSIPATTLRAPKPIDEEISSSPPLPQRPSSTRAKLASAATTGPFWSLSMNASPEVLPVRVARHQGPVGPVNDHSVPGAYSSTYHASSTSPRYSDSSFASTSSNTSPPSEIESPNSPQYGNGNELRIAPVMLYKSPNTSHEYWHRYDRTSPTAAAYDSSAIDKDHTRRVPCTWEGCHATFSRKADVDRHIKSTHNVELIDCDVRSCRRKGELGFARKDHLLEHKRDYHHMEIPKRRIGNSQGRHQG